MLSIYRYFEYLRNEIGQSIREWFGNVKPGFLVKYVSGAFIP